MSANRQKGTSFETAILPWLRAIWPAARRTGSADYGGGDFEFTEDFLIEAKNQKELRLGPWMKQAQRAAQRNGKRFPVVIHKRRTFGPQGAYVTMSLEDWVAALLVAAGQELPPLLNPVSEKEEEVEL